MRNPAACRSRIPTRRACTGREEQRRRRTASRRRCRDASSTARSIDRGASDRRGVLEEGTKLADGVASRTRRGARRKPSTRAGAPATAAPIAANGRRPWSAPAGDRAPCGECVTDPAEGQGSGRQAGRTERRTVGPRLACRVRSPDASAPRPRPTGSSGCRRSTSPRCSAGSPPLRPTAGRPCSTSGAATPRSGRRRTSSRRCARPRAEPDVHGYAPFRGLPRLNEAIARALPRPVRRRARPRARGRDRARHEDGRRRARRSRSASAATRSCCPIPGYPDYPSGVALAGAEVGLLPLDPSAGWAPDFDAAPRRGGRLPQLPVQPVRGLRAARRLRGGGRLRRAHGRGDRRGRRLHRPRLRRPRAGELPRDAGREGRGRRDVDDVEDVRHGRLADRLRRRQRRDRRAGEPAGRPLARRHVRRAPGGGDRRARPARRTRSRSGARPTSAAATGSSPRCPSRRSARAASTSGSGCPEGLTADRLLAEHRVAVAPGEGFGPSGAGWARLSLAVTDEVLERGDRAARAGAGGGVRMKIGIVVPFSWSYWGGVVEHAENQADGAARARARGEDRDGERPAGQADAAAPPAHRAGTGSCRRT